MLRVSGYSFADFINFQLLTFNFRLIDFQLSTFNI